jgi:hypothetical protein
LHVAEAARLCCCRPAQVLGSAASLAEEAQNGTNGMKTGRIAICCRRVNRINPTEPNKPVSVLCPTIAAIVLHTSLLLLMFSLGLDRTFMAV